MMSPFSPIPNYILGTGLTFIGLLGFAKPMALYDGFGVPRPLSAQPDPFSYAKSARDVATGLLFILMETYQEGSGNEDAVTLLWGVTAIIGAADWWIVRGMGSKGMRHKQWVHVGTSAVCAAFAVWRVLW